LPPLGARRTPHRRWSRHAARSVLLAAILLPLTLLSTGNTTALATPTTSARLEDQLDQLNREADQLVEQYNQSNEALARIRKSLKGLRAQGSGAENEMRKLQSSLGARASAE
jgi:chromosome segregation ATPase